MTSPSPRVPLLVASGNPAVAKTLEQQLRHEGYDVLVASSGAQALELAGEHEPQAWVLDARLPDADGRDVCRMVKADTTHGFVPVILVGPCAEPPEDDDLVEDMIVESPGDTATLARWLRSLLRIKRQTDRSAAAAAELNAELRRVELVKESIINHVNHEVRTPLLLVKSFVGMLYKDLEASGATEQVSRLEPAVKSIARLEEVVQNIQQLALTGKAVLVPMIAGEGADLGLQYIERSWRWHDQAWRVEKRVEAGLPAALGDKLITGRLVQLLLENALKFSDSESPVHVHVRRRGKDEVVIAVRDFGIGIEDAQHERIFEAFYQVDAGDDRRHSGTGTGLTLAQLLARSMNTRVEVESVMGEGSTFSFALPAINDLDAWAEEAARTA